MEKKARKRFKYSKAMDAKVAYHIALGANNEDIARILGIFPSTLINLRDKEPSLARALVPPDGVKPYRNHGGARYNKDMDNIAYKMCLLGATDQEMADALEVTRLTILNWRKTKDSFREAINKGKLLADSEVAASLYKRATGYDYDGKHYPPDQRSAMAWLTNRRNKDWQDRREYKLVGDAENMTPWTKIESGIAEDQHSEDQNLEKDLDQLSQEDYEDQEDFEEYQDEDD